MHGCYTVQLNIRLAVVLLPILIFLFLRQRVMSIYWTDLAWSFVIAVFTCCMRWWTSLTVCRCISLRSSHQHMSKHTASTYMSDTYKYEEPLMSVDIIHFRPSAPSALPFLPSSSFSSLLLLLLLLGSGSSNNRSVHLISPHSIFFICICNERTEIWLKLRKTFCSYILL